MLPSTLNTNEIKNAAGTAQPFERRKTSDSELEFKLVAEPPALPHRLYVKHAEVGKGLTKRRRSVVRFDKTVMSTVDATLPVTVSAYCVVDAPVGALNASTEIANVLANLNSFLSTTGAGTTVLFDGTGTGSAALVSGGL